MPPNEIDTPTLHQNLKCTNRLLHAALKRLDFSWNENFGDAAARPLQEIKGLAFLDLAYCDQARPNSAPISQANSASICGRVYDFGERGGVEGDWHVA